MPEEPVPLRFRVLGEVRVWRDGVEVDPGPPGRRTLLALLLARAGSPVQLPDIVDALWADRPPGHAVNMVHRHVGELRRLLEPGLPLRAEGGLLLRGGGGYRLTVPTESVDLLVFRQLVGQARDLGGSAGAVDIFVEALSLRGGDGAGAAGASAPAVTHPLFVELEREYDSVVREAATLALDCGLADRVLTVLASSAARCPLDEGIQALFMRALSATGRPDRALAVFRATAARLADELGVDPGPELTAARPPVTDRPAPSAVSPPAPPAPPTPLPLTTPPVPPAQLPSALPAFVGRHVELERLRVLLEDVDGPRPSSAPVICTIGGTAGVGKTALAVHLAHEVADRFPDGQLYVDLRGFAAGVSPTPPQNAVRGFLDALGVPAARVPESLDAQAALYRSLLAGRRMLVVLDNARDAAQVRPLLPGAAGCLVLVTSRNRLGGLASADGARPLTLDLVTSDDARNALAARIGADRVAAEPEAVAEIVALTARLPLALAVVAARAVVHPSFPLSALADQLRGSHRSLDGFRDAGADTATDVRAVFSWSYDALGAEAARLFRLLALHPGPDLTVHTAAALADLAVGRARSLLAELADAHLLTERAPGRYVFHDLLHAYATELVHADESAEQQRGAVRRLLDHCLHTAHAAALLYDPPTAVITPAEASQESVRAQALADETAACAWFRTERPLLLGVFKQALEHGLDGHVWQLAWCLERFHERLGHWHEYLDLQRAALPAARRLDDPVALGHAHRGLGRACVMLRHYAEAEEQLRCAQGVFEEVGDGHGLAQVQLSLWLLLTRQERFKEGLDELAPTLGIYRASGHRRGQAYVLVATAWGEACLGDCRNALVHAHQALALFQELGARLPEGYTWDTLGHVHTQLGEHRRSVTCHQRALALFREAGDLFNVACVLDRLGDAHLAAGDRAAALSTWRAAREAMRDFDPVWAAEVRRKIDARGGEVPRS
ncbi:BTAD domain-containing putative transcriptional regulator [Streptomyces sp. NPDC002680]|uniref:AfsR/SARP family transcriptional regulator n=1 Tax=Streptomyces sp. NPDC002680 TaxID=3364659 RepID=UPI0036BC2C37